MKSIREDYIRDEEDDDFLLFNPEWKVMPSIAFVSGKGPVILTCKEHDNGTENLMIHTCRWKHNLPSKNPDQLCQAVIQPRLLKPMKASKYSFGYQMFQQTGTFSGIDTCTASSYGRFDLPKSMLLNESESRSLFNRHDINIHLQTLQKEKIISEVVAKSKISMAKSFSSKFDYSKYYKGATYVSLEASVMLQNEASSRQITATINKRETADVCVSFNRYCQGKCYHI